MIIIPKQFKQLIEKDQNLNGVVHLVLSKFDKWLSINNLVFFDEYTDHGTTHINDVLLSSEAMIADNAWPLLNATDAFVIVVSTILHDCAMHLSEDGFIHLVSGRFPQAQTSLHLQDIKWEILWENFLSEALRWDGKKLKSMFGSTDPIRRPNLQNRLELSKKDKMLIGEFIRRHHGQLAHEIALNGLPSTAGEVLKIEFENQKLLDVCGFVARSHTMHLRKACDLLPKSSKREYMQCHVPFIMGVLRIADYIQVQEARAPKEQMMIKNLLSPISRNEYKKHHAIEDIHMTHDDPEALYVQAKPINAEIFVGLQRLFEGIQNELDAVWAVYGEIYASYIKLRDIGINIRRIRSNLDDVQEFIKEVHPDYIPEKIAFRAADAEMLNLLVKPLYGDNPAVGIREMMQNGVDACRERHTYLLNHASSRADEYYRHATVTIKLFKEEDYYVCQVRDNGIGMSLDVIKNYFLNIGASFRNSDGWKKEYVDELGRSKVYRTGRFGIGVLGAFLLGDTIKVTTRHMHDEMHGYRFTCNMDDNYIEVEKLECEIGTTIEIRCDEDNYKRLSENTNTWDWFCFKWPKVERVIGTSQSLKQYFELPDFSVKLPDGFYKIENKLYDEIIWTYSLEKRNKINSYYSNDKHFDGLICNGVFVTHSMNDYRSNHRLEFEIADAFAIRAETPALLILDQDGRFPINLQRDNITDTSFEFLVDLQNSIAEKYVDNLLYDLKNISLSSKYMQLDMDTIFTKRYRDYIFWPKVFLNANGVIPLERFTIQKMKPKRLMVQTIDNDQQLSKQFFGESSIDGCIPINPPNQTIGERVQIIRNIMYENWKLSRINNQDALIGRAIVMRKSEIRELSKKTNFPKSIITLSKTIEINDEWIVLSQGTISLPLELINAYVENYSEIEFYGLGFFEFDWDLIQQTDEISSFTDSWIRKVDQIVYPYCINE